MSHEDPQLREHRTETNVHERTRDSGTFLPFVVGGLVVVAIIFGILFYSGWFGATDTSDVDVTIEEPATDTAPVPDAAPAPETAPPAAPPAAEPPAAPPAPEPPATEPAPQPN